LVLELGFRPVVTSTHPFGFDVERTVPCDRWLRRQQQHLDHGALRALLAGTVPALRGEIAGLGTTVAVDVKHIYAWVQENNPKAYVANRHDPDRRPRGDPDCRLGVKRSTNQEHADGRTTVHKEFVWGYGTGLVSATDRRYGDVVLAEWTQPFNEHDVTFYHPLHRQAAAALGRSPTNVAADAAFDAWHVYQTCVATGGIAAIPLNLRGQAPPDRDDQGRPRCAKGLAMVPRYRFTHEDGYRVQRYGCPLLVPTPSGQACDDPHFRAGPGCVTGINLEPGGIMRATLDRHADTYKAIYRQRTSAERINSQATALGIERPRVRNAQSVHRLNTLTYIVINARALQRARALNATTPRALSQC
jgi:Transposase DDE domain